MCTACENPLVSVIMPAYNAERYIAASIASVMAQTMQAWELIVIDDGSNDGTMQIVQNMAKEDPRIRLCPNESNMGTARSRNRGMDLSRGQYIAFLDSDDIWHPQKLEKQLSCMQETGADLVYTAYAIVDTEGVKQRPDYCVPAYVDINGLLKENVIGCSTVLLNQKASEQFRFQADFYHEDYVLWLQMLQAGCVMAGVQEVLMDYCYRPDSRAGNKWASAKMRWQIYRKYLGMSEWKSARYMLHYALAGVKKYAK